MRSLQPLLAFTLLICASRIAGAQRETGLVVIATDNATKGPVPYADVAILRLGREALANDRGIARLDNISAGRHELRVRRVGYSPVRRTIDVSGADTVRVSLSRLAFQLGAIRSTDAVCPARPAGDTVTLAVIEQMRLNADRARLLAELFPHSYRVERIWSDEGGGRRHADTMTVSSVPDWSYAPGKLIVRANDPADPNPERMVLPQLVHLASAEWSDFHCFRVAGRQKLDGKDRIRIDFEPVKTLKEPDLFGSVYLDTATYQLVETRMTMNRPTSGGGLAVQVMTKYVEVFPGIVVAQQTCVRTTPRESPGGRSALESQRLLLVAFDSTSPGAQAIDVTSTACPRR